LYAYFSREESERVTWGETNTGSFSEAAVEGLISCAGDGARFIDAVWMVSAISRGRESAILAVGGVLADQLCLEMELALRIFEERELPRSLIGLFQGAWLSYLEAKEANKSTKHTSTVPWKGG
jgi:hypothetical protein